MKDRIPFNLWSKTRIALGVKKCTSRHKKYLKDTRVTWISSKIPWYIIRTYLFDAEGAKSPAELQTIIEDIYKRKVPDDEGFYVHFGDFSDELNSLSNENKKKHYNIGLRSSVNSEITDKGLKEIKKKSNYLKRCSEDEDFRRKEINTKNSKQTKEE